MSLPRYPSYKDSGVEWLGEVPEHWHHVRVKNLFVIGRGRVISLEAANEDGTYPVFSSQTTNDGCLGYIETFDFDCDQLTWTTDGANAGTVFLRKGKHNCTNVCGTLQVKNDADFNLSFGLYYLTFVTQFYKRPDTNGAKIMNGEMAEIAMLVPPLPEQTQIAAFLDRETAKIDELVAEQRRLMELLKEKRQAVISHAVTQGLNPYAPMKPSAIEWLGDVPAHWEVKKIKHNLRLLTEKTDRRDHPVALENIESWTGRFIFTDTEFQGEGIAFDEDDILFGKLRPYLAKAYRAESSGEAVGDFHVMRPVTGINSRFAQYQILNREFIAIVDGSTFGSKMPRASWEFVGGMKVTTPPLPEQTQIAAFLDSESAKLDTLTAEAQRAIDLLQERRTALISAAVTGQIDVRPH